MVLNVTIFNQELWGEIGQDEMERDKMILQLEEDCLNVYRKKVDETRKQKADLLQALSFGEADIDKILSALGERESFPRVSFFFCHQSFSVVSVVVGMQFQADIKKIFVYSVREAWGHINGTTCKDRASAERFETEER
jgi:hypothetical protein